MDFTTIAFSGFLIVLSAGLCVGHWRGWQGDQNLKPDERTLDYAQRKYRRRMQASVMIGVTGIAILIGEALPPRPLLLTFYWIAIVAWVVWIAVLACADMLATNFHYQDVQQDEIILKTQLENELRRSVHEPANNRASDKVRDES